MEQFLHGATPWGGFAPQDGSGMDGNYEKPKSVTCSEILNFNPRLSALQDFMTRTMSVLHGIWSKLNYIRELRTQEGGYEHWGMTTIYGEAAANQMIADVHSELYLQLLRTSLPDLLEQLELSAQDAGCSPRQLAEQLYENRRRITPQDHKGGAPEHMRSVLLIADLFTKHS